MTVGNELQQGIAQSVARARWVTVLLAGCISGAALGVLTGVRQLDLLHRIVAGEVIPESEASWNDTLYGGIGLVQTAMFVACSVLWLVWLKRAYANLLLVGTRTARFSPGWAVGYWFVPVVNLVRPYQVMKDLSVRSAQRNEHDGTMAAGTTTLVGLWWFAHLASGIAGRVFFRQALGADEVQGFITLTQAGLVTDAATILSGVLALVMVRGITRSQSAWPSEAIAAAVVPPSIEPSSA